MQKEKTRSGTRTRHLWLQNLTHTHSAIRSSIHRALHLTYIEIKFFEFSMCFVHWSNFSPKNRICKVDKRNFIWHMFQYYSCYIKQSKILNPFWLIIVSFFTSIYSIFWWKIWRMWKTHWKPQKLYFYINKYNARWIDERMAEWVCVMFWSQRCLVRVLAPTFSFCIKS